MYATGPTHLPLQTAHNGAAGRANVGVHVGRAPSMERELIERCVGRGPSVER